MAILSHAHYLSRWTSTAPNGFGQTICPPCYHEYLQREIYFNDYLDLFRNVRTFVRRLHLGRFYVAITNLEIPEHDIYTINIGGILYLLVDYDYPWNEEELMKKRCIKYIMIGEAAPAQNAKIVGYGADDKENSFYYNILHIKNTGYFTEPLKAFDIKTSAKRDALIELANKSSILLDIFPFAINYDSIRYHLNKKGITEKYFKELMDSLEKLFNEKKCRFSENLKGVFVAPPKISHSLAPIEVNNSLISINNKENNFEVLHDTKNNFFFCKISSTNGLKTKHGFIELPPNTKNNKYAIQVPKYICCAYSGAMTVPHYLFIKNALDLLYKQYKSC